MGKNGKVVIEVLTKKDDEIGWETIHEGSVDDAENFRKFVYPKT